MQIKVLIVEDDQAIRSSLNAYIEMLGHKVLTVESGEKAIVALNESKPDLVLSDYNLGSNVMNGQDVLAKVKEIYPTCFVSIMTAYYEVKGAVQAMKTGAMDYICKPFNLGDIETLINRVITEKNSVKDLNCLEKEHIIKVLADSQTYEEAATKLGINMATLWRKRKSYEIEK